jgi:NTE family protein
VASNIQAAFVDPLLALASETIDVEAVLGGLLLPGGIADKVKHSLRKALFSNKTLQDLPDRPIFVFNTSNLQSGALARFTKAFLWDYRVGKVATPDIELAAVVQASAAFPPVLAPAVFRFKHSDFDPGTGLDLQRPPFTTEMILADGGVYDNMGIETAWKRCATILVSDAGGKTEAEEHPHTDWVRMMVRVGNVVDNQVRSLRKRQLIAAFEADTKEGTYWGVRTDILRYELPDALLCPISRTTELAEVPTRLKAMPTALQHRLVNWGYAVCDAAMRRHMSMANTPTAQFPFPEGV